MSSYVQARLTHGRDASDEIGSDRGLRLEKLGALRHLLYVLLVNSVLRRVRARQLTDAILFVLQLVGLDLAPLRLAVIFLELIGVRSQPA